MAISRRTIREALRRRLLRSTIGLPEDAYRAWENRIFTPPSPEDELLWFREALLPVVQQQNASDQIIRSGFYQINLFFGAGKGTEFIEELAENILTVFKPGTKIQHDAFSIAIDRSEASSGFVVDDVWFMIPVVVSWRTHTAPV